MIMNYSKLIYIITGLLIYSSVVSAQMPYFRFGVRGGFDVAKAFVDDSGSSKLMPGYNVGVTMEYGPVSTIFFRSGLFFTSYSAKINNIYGGDAPVIGGRVDTKTTFNQMSLKLPIMAATKMRVADNLNVVVAAGPYISYGIGGKTKMEFDGLESEKWNTYDDAAYFSLKRFNFGGSINIDLEYAHTYIVGIGGDFGFLNLINQDKYQDRNFQMMNLNISIGYLF